ncbi:unnamed protein product [Allacma fusca]|uniref:Uncharacterized protein n=1 Tax=Allacma fusca TaxID=39272 RepID=A0A8J2P5G6_9HEXA|nr:unnamed protein product [Allacma fusca]
MIGTLALLEKPVQPKRPSCDRSTHITLLPKMLEKPTSRTNDPECSLFDHNGHGKGKFISNGRSQLITLESIRLVQRMSFHVLVGSNNGQILCSRRYIVYLEVHNEFIRNSL